MLVAAHAQRLQKVRQRFDHIHVAGDRLDDDGGDFIADLIHQFVQRIYVVVGQGHGEIGKRCRYAR